MIQNRRHSRHKFGSTKSNKTFDKHNQIKRIKDDELEFDPNNFDLNSLIQEVDEDPILNAYRDDVSGE